jgi:amidase
MAARLSSMFDDHDLLLTPGDVGLGGAGGRDGRAWRHRDLPMGDRAGSRSRSSGTSPVSPPPRSPVGFSREGLPLAVQIVGREHEERTILALAAELEAERPWTDRRPAIA